jgi:DNA-binding response OmpR family regulator
VRPFPRFASDSWAIAPPQCWRGLAMRILYVEDFLPWRDKVIEAYLAGHQVVACATVAEAKDAYRPAAFDAVLLDYELPDGNGAEVAKMIRGQGDKVPIIANSSSGQRNKMLMSLGANYSVAKSSESQLLDVLIEIQAQH